MHLKKVIRVGLHFLFWSAFFALFFIQKEEATLKDYLHWGLILLVSAIVVYTNLYILLPRLFYKKRYLIFIGSLVGLLLLGALILYLLIDRKADFGTPYIQHVINLFFIVVVSSSFSFFSNYLRKQSRLKTLENKQLETELKLLKGQINPHFLFNTLNNLYGLILEKENENAAEIVLKLSGLMRYLLESSRQNSVWLKEEIQFIEDYIALEKLRLSSLFSITFDKDLERKDIKIIPMILIPMVENVFKHSTTSRENSFAYFKISCRENVLLFSSENSVSELQSNDSTKFGLNNLEKRLSLAYPNCYKLNTSQVDSKFYAELKIEL